jgi:hypothetical protein
MHRTYDIRERAPGGRGYLVGMGLGVGVGVEVVADELAACSTKVANAAALDTLSFVIGND